MASPNRGTVRVSLGDVQQVVPSKQKAYSRQYAGNDPSAWLSFSISHAKNQQKLEQKLMTLFIETLEEDSEVSWDFFASVLRGLPPDVFEDYAGPSVHHFVEKVLTQLKNRPRLKVLGLEQAMDRAFPEVMDNVRDGLKKRHGVKAPSPATMRTTAGGGQKSRLSATTAHTVAIGATKQSGIFDFDMTEVQQYDVPNVNIPVVPVISAGKRRGVAMEESRSQPPVKKAATVISSNASVVESEDGSIEQGDFPFRTGVEAVPFFASAGPNDPIKFVYLNRTETGDDFRPYDLEVVPRDAVQSDHYTMSSSGLVHIQPGVPSEFVSLADWMRESTMFNLLRKKRVFKYYLVSKMFKSWRQNVRYKLYCETRQRLTRRLFFAMPTFVEALINVNKFVFDMSNVKLLHISSTHLYGKGEYADVQTGQLKEASKDLETIMEKVQALIEKLCESVVARAQSNDGGEGDEDDLAQQIKSSKSKSMAAQRQEVAQKQRELKRAAAEVGMLGAFVRLLDYVIVENSMLHAVESTGELLEVLQIPRKTGFFQTTIGFGEGEIVYSPSGDDVVKMLVTNSEEIINTVNAVSRLIYMRPFRPYLMKENGQVAKGPHLRGLIQDNVTFLSQRTEIDNIVKNDFVQVFDYGKTFMDFKEISEFGDSWSIDEFKKQEATQENLERMFDKLRKWSSDIDRMKPGNAVGVYFVDSRPLKLTLVPIPVRAMDDMKLYLQVVAKERCHTVLNEYREHMKVLNEKPRHLREFADFIVYIQKMEAEAIRLLNSEKEVDHLYSLLQQYEVKIPTADEIQWDELHEGHEQFKAAHESADLMVQGKLPSMTSNLEKNITTLNEQLLATLSELHNGDFVDKTADPQTVLSKLDAMNKELDGMKERIETYTEYQNLFKLPVTDYTNLKDAEAQYQSRLTVWKSLDEWNEKTTKWLVTPIAEIEAEEINKEVMNDYKNAHRLATKQRDDGVCAFLKEQVEEWKRKMPTVMELGNKALKPRHWEKIFKVLKQSYSPGMSFTLQEMQLYNCYEYATQIGEISAIASGEFSLELILEKIKLGWQKMEFDVRGYREYKDVFILGGVDDVTQLLEDNQVTLQTIAASRFVTGIRDDVEVWEKKLGLLSEVLDEWLLCQRNWMYLEVIFGQPDIQKQLPLEASKFMKVDKHWKELMKKANANPVCMTIVATPNLLDTFLDDNKKLDEIQKSLEDYLETKRVAFPRFYFLSNDELLEILSQTREPRAVQPHLRKCFDSIYGVDFVEENNTVTIASMISAEKENVPLSNAVICKGPVEGWMLNLEKEMRCTLYDETKAALQAYTDEKMCQWFFEFPSQEILTIEQVIWTHSIDAALRSMEKGEAPDALAKYCKKFNAQILEMVALVRGHLSVLQRSTMGALLVINVHARDVLDKMVAVKCGKESDFEWQKQLRYYWDDEVDNCIVRQVSASFVYGYEYLGNTPRLVITPLTDKCYLTLTTALHMRFGGAPAGPAGTGKTETTKDLAKALANQCVVFNCSDGLDYKMMGRFFSGLAQAGAWACFDEFNRIDIEVLSVIAQQVLTIQQALSTNQERFIFEGREISLSTKYGVFITMNPGYAGRTELPDNLKALFRPVAMMIPDYGLIAEIMLFAEGFQEARMLARKMVKMYRLASEQLSQQDHYDFGMRAVKSVLVMAGELKRSNVGASENIVLIRAMRDSNVPKFLADDVPLFTSIIQDLFPGVDIPAVDYGALQQSIETALLGQGLQVVGPVVAKVIQLFETMVVRHGVMVVGETGTAKTTLWRTLQQSLTALRNAENPDERFQIVQVDLLNPKSVRMGELYGEFNAVSHEWTDGLVASLIRGMVADDTPNKKWCVFDGPVDALWIENMNTVLDDNKTLCLANGERIKLPSTIAMMFEVQDLAVASPATVSRCGMVFLEKVYLGWRPVVQTWMARRQERFSEAVCNKLFEMLDGICDETLKFLRRNTKEYIPSVDINLVSSFLKLFDAMAVEATGFKDTAHIEQNLGMLFAFCYFWAFGGNVEDSTRAKFEDFARGKLSPLCATLPEGSLFDYVISPAGFEPWANRMRDFVYDPAQPYFSILVPTTETTCFGFLMERLIHAGYSIMVTGETGVGKSVVAEQVLDLEAQRVPNSEDPNDFGVLPLKAAFSAQTSSQNLQDVFESKLEKKRKTLYGAPAGKKIVCFIDDLNMPQLETYGAQPPIELLRQTIDQGGFYDRQKLFFKEVKDVVFIAGLAPPGGGRNVVTPRLVRHFVQFCMPQLSTTSMQKIFASILGGFLKPFAAPLNDMADKIIQASVVMYNRIANELLPTPSKSHYTFNLRDLSKVVQGMLNVKPAEIDSSEKLLRLWTHESSRVFRDRLINEEDRKLFDEFIQSELGDKFELNWELSDFNAVLFGEYLSKDPENPRYDQVTDLARFRAKLVESLEDFNLSTSKEMNLVFFEDAMSHISRIYRILRQPRGNALLVGVGGSGRQSLTKLAAHIAGFRLFQIEVSKNYGHTEFREDLKNLLLDAGCKNEPVVFLFSDTQIVKEAFLEDINNILNAGEVPNLFQSDSYERITNDVRPLAKAAGKVDTKDVIYSHFVQLVRENLHMVLAMSPIGDAFRRRCRMFPSLVNCCTIDWFSAWPDTALLSVARHFLDNVDLGEEKVHEAVCHMCVHIHSSVEQTSVKFFNQLKRKNYTTPTSYLELINLYVAMLGEQRDIIKGKIQRLRGGLDKLESTNALVAQMKIELSDMQPILAKAAVDTANLLVEIQGDQKEADEVKASVSKEEKEVTKIAEETQVMRDDAQADLDEALPAYYAAIKSLKSLNKGDLTELKGFTKPPELVVTVMEGVCLLLGRKTTWEEAKKLLGEMNMLKMLEEYDKDHIPPAVERKLKKYIDNPDFVPDKVQKVSAAAKSLCMWVRAMDTYGRIFKTVAPKKQALADAEESLNKMNAMLAEKRAVLKEVEERVAALQRKYEDSLKQRDDLEKQINNTQVRLARAEKLVTGLGGEQSRWTSTAEAYEVDMVNLVGDMVIGAGCVAYMGPFTAEYRQALISGWAKHARSIGIDCDLQFSLTRSLGDPVVMRDWGIWGLPADNLSLENGILVSRGRRWPLMIDPQGQANRWVKNMEKANNLKVCKLTEPNFLRTLENAIRVGQPVLLENVEEVLDPALEPVLLKQIFKQGGRFMIRLGDTDVDYNKDFKLYMTSKLPNPHYMPEICIKVTVINFTVTPKGLEDQLLADVVRLERPDLEEQKDNLVVQTSRDRKQLKQIEDQILSLLANSSGNILDDEVLINTLDQSKKTSEDINRRVQEAEETTLLIDRAREDYRPVALRGSILYFVVADLGNVDPMYQYSLAFFADLFCRNIQKADRSDDLQERLGILIKTITESVYLNVCRGLFEKDKLLFSYLIAVRIELSKGKLLNEDWDFFVRGPGIIDAASLPENRYEEWMPTKTWGTLVYLDKNLPSFHGLLNSLMADSDSWKTFAEHADPFSLDLPKSFLGDTSDNANKTDRDFLKLALVNVFLEEKTVPAVRDYIGSHLGKFFIESPPFDLEGAYNDSTAQTPLIFVLSAGADPMAYLLNLAAQMGFSEKMRSISLGQGQGPIAQRLILEGTKEGNWICLQNCHLAASWMPAMERLLEELAGKEINPNFRLWLTSMPSKTFPVPVLQVGLKITNEPPKGLKANLSRSYGDLSEQLFESCAKPAPWKKLLFGLCSFHAIIQERRKFGSLGWNIPYEWNNSDLTISIKLLKMYLEEQEEVPFDTLRYITGEVNYGGRVTDHWDQRTMNSIISRLICSEMLDDTYRFDNQGKYYAPPQGELSDYRDYINSLPLRDSPDVFGLHSNADITFNRQETRTVIETIITMSGGGAGDAGGADVEANVAVVAQDIQDRLPAILDTENSHPTTFALVEGGAMNSLGTDLAQEILKYNRLLRVMLSSLKDLQRAIKGLVVMSSQLEEVFFSVYFNQVPKMWAAKAYPSLKPLGSWVYDLIARVEFIRGWTVSGPPTSFWLSGLFFPQGFMTAVLQTHARKTRLPIDSLVFRTHVTKAASVDELTTSPQDGVYIYGLFLEGARWDAPSHLLAESNVGELMSAVPPMWIEPLAMEDHVPSGVYDCPMYKESTRRGTLSTTGHSTNFVTSLELPTDLDTTHWIRRGVAMLCQLDD